MLETGTRKCSTNYRRIFPCLPALTAYLWLFTLMGSVTAQEGKEGTSFKCYTNGQKSGMLRLDVGENGLSECVTKTECSEAVASPKAGHKTAMYFSGCNGCPKWKFEFECKTCKQELCNKQLANNIMTKNRICFIAQDEETLGVKTVFCADGVVSCFYHQYTGQKEKDRYTAGCGTGWTDCSDCTVCEKDACNVPDDLKSKAQIPERPTQAGAPSGAAVKPKAKKKGTGVKGSGSSNSTSTKGGESEEEEEDEKTVAPLGKGKGKGKGKKVTEAPGPGGKKGKNGDEEDDAAADDGGGRGGAASSGSAAVAAAYFIVALTAAVPYGGLVVLA